MGLWLLSFTGRCNAVVIKGESLIQARLLAAVDGLGRASHFDEGFAIDPGCAGQIPPNRTTVVGRRSCRFANYADDWIAGAGSLQ
jgi:hypothetical protein